jgi:ribosome-binding factor A
MSKFRDKKLAKFIHHEISFLLTKGLKDPRLSDWTTITEVDVTKDLRNATVYFSVRGTDKEKKSTLMALNSAKGFIKNHLSNHLRIKFMPEIDFKLDESLEKGYDLISKINQLSKEWQDETSEDDPIDSSDDNQELPP